MIQLIQTPKQKEREARAQAICNMYRELKAQYPTTAEWPIYNTIAQHIKCSPECVRATVINKKLYVPRKKMVRL